MQILKEGKLGVGFDAPVNGSGEVGKCSVVPASLEESRCWRPEKRVCKDYSFYQRKRGGEGLLEPGSDPPPTGPYGPETVWCPLALMRGREGRKEGKNRGLSE